jgi:hypothetical protein
MDPRIQIQIHTKILWIRTKGRGKNMISSPWDEKEDLDGLVVPAPRHKSRRHIGHEVWIRGSRSRSIPKFHGSAQNEGKKHDILTVE